jgi:hypothetical protein
MANIITTIYKIKTLLSINTIKYILCFVFFLLGIYYYANVIDIRETMTNNNSATSTSSSSSTTSSTSNTKKSDLIKSKCPNMLIEKDGAIYLFNSLKPLNEKNNPIKFDNLEDYSKYYKKQKNIDNCPLLVLQYTTDTQNNELVQIKPSIFENDGGLNVKNGKIDKKKLEQYFEENKMLDATKDSTPNSQIMFNSNLFPGFDGHNQNIGLDSPLDQMYYEKNPKSANPMDPHWGGKDYTKKAVDNGNYEDRYVFKKKNLSVN